MAARIGPGLYWGCRGLALLIVAVTVWYNASDAGRFMWDEVGLAVAVGAIFWVLGGACLSLLGGK